MNNKTDDLAKLETNVRTFIKWILRIIVIVLIFYIIGLLIIRVQPDNEIVVEDMQIIMGGMLTLVASYLLVNVKEL